IRALTPKIAVVDEVHLFAVQPTLAWRQHGPVHSRVDKYAGENPPSGAILHYYLKNQAEKPVTLEVLDEQGTVIRALSKDDDDDEPADDPDGPEEPPKKKLPSREAGVQRFVWDLRYEGAARIKKAK